MSCECGKHWNSESSGFGNRLGTDLTYGRTLEGCGWCTAANHFWRAPIAIERKRGARSCMPRSATPLGELWRVVGGACQQREHTGGRVGDNEQCCSIPANHFWRAPIAIKRKRGARSCMPRSATPATWTDPNQPFMTVKWNAGQTLYNFRRTYLIIWMSCECGKHWFIEVIYDAVNWHTKKVERRSSWFFDNRLANTYYLP